MAYAWGALARLSVGRIENAGLSGPEESVTALRYGLF
jgi:hypothetical protein